MEAAEGVQKAAEWVEARRMEETGRRCDNAEEVTAIDAMDALVDARVVEVLDVLDWDRKRMIDNGMCIVRARCLNNPSSPTGTRGNRKSGG